MDDHKNLAVSAVATAPSPAASGTSLVVTAAHGTRFPTPPFNVTIWPTASQPTPANAEIARCTAVATDTLTIVRAQEGTSARTVVVGDQVAATITDKTLTDIEQQWIRYTYDSASTADSDPGAGKLKFNNADPLAATFIYVDDADFAGFSQDAYFSSWAGNPMATYGYLRLVSAADASDWVEYAVTDVTDGTGYWKLQVMLWSSDGALTTTAGDTTFTFNRTSLFWSPYVSDDDPAPDFPDLGPGFHWFDTDEGADGASKIRNAADDGWIELGEKAALDAHLADASDAHAASAISILDAASDFTATDVEGALAELQTDHEADATALSDHVADTSAAHAASAISIADAGSDFTATDVEGALDELQADAEAHVAAADPHAGYVLESLYDANTVLAANSDNTPLALTMAASTILARLAAGNIVAATPSQLRTLLDVPTTGEAVLDTLYDANTVLTADSDNTPAALTMGASTILARLAAGNIVAATPAQLRTLLALVVGTDVQAFDAELAAIAGLTSAADRVAYFTGSGTAALATFTAFARTLLDDADAAAARATLGIEKVVQLKIVDDATVLTTGDGKLIFCVSDDLNALNLVDADAFVTTVSSSGLPTVQIRNITQAADMLTTKISIDASEFTSYTANDAPVIDGANDDVATGDLIAIDVDVAGTGAKGLGVILTFGP